MFKVSYPLYDHAQIYAPTASCYHTKKKKKKKKLVWLNNSDVVVEEELFSFSHRYTFLNLRLVS